MPINLLIFLLLLHNSTMGSCHTLQSSATTIETKALAIDTSFKLPSPLPSWPPGNGFASGTIDLGGLVVCQISSLTKVWATHEGGPDNLGASFYVPSALPDGFFMLGSYAQPNNQALYGWVLVGKDTSSSALKLPIDYALVWSSESLDIKKEGNGYIWSPVPPDGYKALGYIITGSCDKPPLDKVRCVRADLAEKCKADSWIWGQGKSSNSSGLNLFTCQPTTRGIQAQGVSVGSFVADISGVRSPSLSCLKNKGNISSNMPNLDQIKALFEAYSPFIYFHPREKYFPSSVNWFFSNGALLYHKGNESNPIRIQPNGENLPLGGSSKDGMYWLDLPQDIGSKDKVKKGDLHSSEVYLHVKSMFGGTSTDIVVWFFYPFNGPARAKIELITISFKKIGEHVGDWEHVTLRISNFNGELSKVYFSQHGRGTWVDPPNLEFQTGNKPIAYSSLHGHAMYSKAGLVLDGNGGIGIRNDAAKSKTAMDAGVRYSVVAVGYLGTDIVEPPWLNYTRKWGPRIDYDINFELKKVEEMLPKKLKPKFEKFVRSLPHQIRGEHGPYGPRMKKNWNGDEV
ncbi:Vacuolar protein sorting-associated protein 62 [Dillenia turbinata]|uniref:Vacuolar protein sorting-associated protein 62 n=1 Tax=Dillenia turbinata TaxID=194707 RepID=A0AAN8VPD4_9MAGN